MTTYAKYADMYRQRIAKSEPRVSHPKNLPAIKGAIHDIAPLPKPTTTLDQPAATINEPFTTHHQPYARWRQSRSNPVAVGLSDPRQIGLCHFFGGPAAENHPSVQQGRCGQRSDRSHFQRTEITVREDLEYRQIGQTLAKFFGNARIGHTTTQKPT